MTGLEAVVALTVLNRVMDSFLPRGPEREGAAVVRNEVTPTPQCAYLVRGSTVFLKQSEILADQTAVCLPHGESATRSTPEPVQCDPSSGVCFQQVLTYSTLQVQEIPYRWVVVFD